MMAKRRGEVKEVKEASLQGKIKSEIPKHALEEALRVAERLESANGGQPLPPIETASALAMSPGSSDFRVILSSSIKYGLTSGSFNSERVSLEEKGRNIVKATSDEAKRKALVEAALTPSTFRAIYQHFKGKKLPEPTFFENTIVREFDVPREHSKKCIEIFTKNAEYVGLVRSLPSGKWLSTAPLAEPENAEEAEPEAELGTEKGDEKPGLSPIAHPKSGGDTTKPKVFIAHGKSAQVVSQ